MRKRIGTAAAVCMVALSATGVALGHSDDDGDGILKDERHFRDQALKTYTGGSKDGSAVNMGVVGHNDLGARGFNADVWTHEGYPYVGHWGFTDWATGNDRFCPSGSASGVAVVDARDP